MPNYARTLLAAVVLSLPAVPAAAQEPAGLMGELVKDVTAVQARLVSLARELPDTALAWRPGAGVRSSAEVLLHVASDNYLLPAGVGVAIPAATGISATDFSTLATYEKRQLSRAEMIAEIDRSFVHLLAAMSATPPARLDETITFFGQQMTVRYLWVLTTAHLHEHLGQLIAYTRTNGVTPPWSRQGQ
jgi:uncharacterized damage-inducible protein DinB